jgi:hypothetical protein
MFYSLLLYCFTFFGERGEVPIGLSFSAGVDTKKNRSNFHSNFPQPQYNRVDKIRLINLKGNIDFLAGEKIPTGQTAPEKKAVLR